MIYLFQNYHQYIISSYFTNYTIHAIISWELVVDEKISYDR